MLFTPFEIGCLCIIAALCLVMLGVAGWAIGDYVRGRFVKQ